ncbi:MAG TPA: hypothetical protein VEX38_02445 [Fimbriimonadaceae bacterium]|nr:hypothetical protein [Fimbriimonadaceae bacterium]
MITALWLFLLTLAGAGVATGLARSFALRQHIMDVPNERSSHTKPVPRGGGVGIVAVVLASVLVLSLLGHVGSQLALALILGGTLVAAVGWIDDRRHVPAPIRAAVHLTAASMAVILLGGPTKFHLGGASLEGGWIVMALAAIAIV